MSASTNSPHSKILFVLSGSIACFKAAAVISTLVKQGHEIEVVATESALKFIGEATLEGLTGRQVHTGTFVPGEYMSHIHLVEWANLTVLCPATANTINKFAAGIGDDLASTLFLAHDFQKPYLIFPAMNTKMLNHPATAASISKLQSWGVDVSATGDGNLACGQIGSGRLLEPDEIVRKIQDVLSSAPKRVTQAGQPLRKVLITSGGTTEAIDGVRSITNFSTGASGSALADKLTMLGHQVTLLKAKSAVAPSLSSQIRLESFVNTDELKVQLMRILSEQSYDLVVHMAAVSDFVVDEIVQNGKVFASNSQIKLDSKADLVMRLRPNQKILPQIKNWSQNKNLVLIAFKLTQNRSLAERAEKIQQIFSNSDADLVVSNDLSEIRNPDQHPMQLHTRSGPSTTMNSMNELALVVGEILRNSEKSFESKISIQLPVSESEKSHDLMS